MLFLFHLISDAQEMFSSLEYAAVIQMTKEAKEDRMKTGTS